MKKTKLLLPLTAVAGLTAVIPAMCLTSCNKGGSTKTTKPTEEEWNNAFKALTERSDEVCWHTTAESSVTYAYGSTYEEADNAIKYTGIECGQKYSKMKYEYKTTFGNGSKVVYSTMNNEAPNIIVSEDVDGVVKGSTASTNVDFQVVLQWISSYAASYADFKYNEETKIFEYSVTNDVTQESSQIKFNDNKQVEYIQSVAKDSSDGYIGLNLHFTYDKTEVSIPTEVNKEITRNQISMKSSTYTIDDDEESEDGIDRGIALTIKPSMSFSSLKAAYPTAGDTPAIFANERTEIYKNGKKLTINTDYTLFRPTAVGISFTEAVKTSDTIVVCFNLLSSFYFGGTTNTITLTLS